MTIDRITCITGTDKFSNIKCFVDFANAAGVTDITFGCITGTNSFTNI